MLWGAAPRRPSSSPRGNRTNCVTARNPSYTRREETQMESPPQTPGKRIKTSRRHGGGAAGAHEQLSRPPPAPPGPAAGARGGSGRRAEHQLPRPSPFIPPCALGGCRRRLQNQRNGAGKSPRPPAQLGRAGRRACPPRCPQAPSPSRPVPAGPVRGGSSSPGRFLPLSGSDI